MNSDSSARFLKQYFDYSTFRGQQEEIIQHVMSGNHALVIMPTGMGKSICYQIPALLHRQANSDSAASDQSGLTLVMSPLIALMKDQVDGLVKRGIDATFINSSLSREQREQRNAGIARGDFDLLYVTPERFRKPEFLDVISRRQVHLLAVDEAHCISEWGHDFRPDYTRVAEFRRILGDPTTIALTATATPDVQRDIVRQLGIAEDVRLFHEGIDRPNLRLTVENVWGTDDKLDHILRIREELSDERGSGIVYFTLVRTLDEFSERLKQMRIPHFCYHGKLDRDKRRRVQNQFMQQRRSWVLATNAFGMGIDKEDIRFVIHADVPGSMESYYQEIGRAGRDGLPAQCSLLYDEADLATQMQFIEWSNPNAEFYYRVHQLLLHDMEKIAAFGIEWLSERLHFKDKHDHRLSTVLSVLDRWGVIEGTLDPVNLEVAEELPAELTDQDQLDEKRLRDQLKLYKLVEYVQHDESRKAFIHDYFGLPYHGDDA